MKQAISSLVIVFSYLSVTAAQTTSLDASSCVAGSGVTALPNCDFIDQTTNNCTSLPKADQINCWCNQKVFNAIIE
jgi:hypothetical protein